jgi:hypothetical protein
MYFREIVFRSVQMEIQLLSLGIEMMILKGLPIFLPAVETYGHNKKKS